MTPPDWASKKVGKVKVLKGETDVQFMARLLRNEHTRAMRVVERYLKAYGTEGSPCELICNDLLHKLKEGRT